MSSIRLKSIDILRALTMLLMIFVNDLWTLTDIPQWLGHKAGNVDVKKWVKMVRFSIGMRATENAAKKATYKTVWVAGPSIEHTKEILSVKAIVEKLTH